MNESLLEIVVSRVEKCTKCNLCATRTHTVPGEGNPLSKLMFVGEGPGEQEDLQGRPFIGRAGGLLNEGLERAGIDRQRIFITNIVKCRPPGNRNPSQEEMEACHDHLRSQIEIVRPEMIVVLGKVAAEFLLQRPVKITKECGDLDFLQDGTMVMVVFHPAYVLRNQKKEVREAFFQAIQEAKLLTDG